MAKIVVIEDNDEILNEVMAWLQADDHTVTGASNGQQGMEAIHQTIPDLIICDISMPEMDGHEVLIEVRSTRSLSRIPFIFLTAAGDRVSVRKGMNLGADDYLSKPVTRAEVLNATRSRLKKQAEQDVQLLSLLNILNSAFAEERERYLIKSRMVAMFSHDFRNPLQSILSSSNIIRNYEQRLSPERKAQHFESIAGSVHLLLQMIDDMMMVAELEDGRLKYSPQVVNLTVFLEAIVEELRLIDQNAHVLTLHSTVQSWVEADPKLLRQIFVNLISNAIKYSPADAGIIILLTEDGGRIILSVQDEGIGIPESDQAHLFTPFYRASNANSVKGTGLGLCIVKDCVERHRGTIEVTSQVGKGTTFIVALPFIPM